MKFAIAAVLSFASLAAAAPGYSPDSSATMWGSFTPAAYECAAKAGNSVKVSSGDDTRRICNDQDWIDAFWCCLSEPTVEEPDRTAGWDTLVAQCQAYSVPLGDKNLAHARSAAATQNYEASNSTEVPTVTAGASNETTVSGVPSTASGEAAPEATGAGTRPAGSLVVLGSALIGALVMLTL